MMKGAVHVTALFLLRMREVPLNSPVSRHSKRGHHWDAEEISTLRLFPGWWTAAGSVDTTLS